MMTGNGEIIYNTLVVSMKFYGPTFPTFQDLTFLPETFWHRNPSTGHTSTCMIRPCRCSSAWTFCLHECFGIRSFRHRDKKNFLAPWTFQHGYISIHGYFGTWTIRQSSTGAEMSVLKCPYCFARCQNIHMLESIPCRNIYGAKNSLCQKCPCAGMSVGSKYACAKMS